MASHCANQEEQELVRTRSQSLHQLKVRYAQAVPHTAQFLVPGVTGLVWLVLMAVDVRQEGLRPLSSVAVGHCEGRGKKVVGEEGRTELADCCALYRARWWGARSLENANQGV